MIRFPMGLHLMFCCTRPPFNFIQTLFQTAVNMFVICRPVFFDFFVNLNKIQNNWNQNSKTILLNPCILHSHEIQDNLQNRTCIWMSVFINYRIFQAEYSLLRQNRLPKFYRIKIVDIEVKPRPLDDDIERLFLPT